MLYFTIIFKITRKIVMSYAKIIKLGFKKHIDWGLKVCACAKTNQPPPPRDSHRFA